MFNIVIITFITFLSTTLVFSDIGILKRMAQGVSLDELNNLRPISAKVTKKVVSSKKFKHLKNTRKNVKKEYRPYFYVDEASIKTLDQFYVMIGGNLKIMGDSQERVKVYSLSKSFPKDAYFSCESYNSAIQYHYRIKFKCDRLVTLDKEYEIEAHIKDLKLIGGITPDHVSTGEEEGLIKQFILGITASMLDMDKNRVLTANGYQEVPSSSNVLKESTIDGIKNMNSTLSSKDSKSLVLALKGQRKAVIEFLKPFKFKGDTL